MTIRTLILTLVLYFSIKQLHAQKSADSLLFGSWKIINYGINNYFFNYNDSIEIMSFYNDNTFQIRWKNTIDTIKLQNGNRYSWSAGVWELSDKGKYLNFRTIHKVPYDMQQVTRKNKILIKELTDSSLVLSSKDRKRKSNIEYTKIAPLTKVIDDYSPSLMSYNNLYLVNSLNASKKIKLNNEDKYITPLIVVLNTIKSDTTFLSRKINYSAFIEGSTDTSLVIENLSSEIITEYHNGKKTVLQNDFNGLNSGTDDLEIMYKDIDCIRFSHPLSQSIGSGVAFFSFITSFIVVF